MNKKAPKPAKQKLTARQKKLQVEIRAEQRKFLYERKKERIATTELYQRRIFIEALRSGKSFFDAMADAGITDRYTALLIYDKNSRPVTRRVLLDQEKVR